MSERRSIYCCGCEADVDARLTDGREIYPHRSDLAALPFWKCDTCGNFVGCHHKTGNPTQPLGVIPTPAIKNARKHIHAVLDPIWKQKRMKRGDLYRAVADRLGLDEYHTAEIRSLDDARKAYAAIQEIAAQKSHSCFLCHRHFGSQVALDQHVRSKHPRDELVELRARRAGT